MRVLAVLFTSLLLACGSFAASEPTAAPPIDAGAERADDAAAPARPRSCEGAVLVEDDFSGSVISRAWSVEGAPVLTLDDGQPAPSLRAVTGALTGGEEKNVVGRTVGGARARLCIEFDVRMEAEPASYGDGAFTEILALYPERIFVEVRSSGMVLGVQSDASPLAAFSFGKWVHVVVHIDYAKASPAVEVEIDGARVARPIGATAPPSIDVFLGAFSAKVAGAATVHADNFVITAP